MNTNRARELLLRERAEVEGLLKGLDKSDADDFDAEGEVGDEVDHAQPLAAEYDDEAVASRLSDRLEAIDRALKRIEDGKYGLSVRSGEPIPDERLEADPAAELTVEEARSER